ncbi:MAG: dockerin type I domain-containing protein [Bacteroidota bacterium]
MTQISNLKRYFLLLLLLSCGTGPMWAQTVFVWPGDANDNGQVSVVDLLYIGRWFGDTGPARDSVSLNWVPHEAPKWIAPIAGRADPAHADCNGDSTVNALDIAAIELNYGRDNGYIVPDSSSISTAPTDPPLTFVFPPNGLAAGARDTITLRLGTAALPVDSLLGFAATISYDTSLIDTAYAYFGNSWLGTPGSDLLHIDRIDGNELSIAATRNDRNSVRNAYGDIGGIVVVMDDNLKRQARLEELDLNFEAVLGLTESGRVVAVTPSMGTGEVYTEATPLQANVYPVPATERVTIDLLNPIVAPVEGRLFGPAGNLVASWNMEQRRMNLPLEAYLPGMYVLELRTENAVLRKKILVLR